MYTSVLKRLVCSGLLYILVSVASVYSYSASYSECDISDFEVYYRSMTEANYLDQKSLLSNEHNRSQIELLANIEAIKQTRLDWHHFDHLLTAYPEFCSLQRGQNFNLIFAMLKKYTALLQVLKSGDISAGHIVNYAGASNGLNHFITNLILHLDQLADWHQNLEISEAETLSFHSLARCIEPRAKKQSEAWLVYHAGFSHLIHLINKHEPTTRLVAFTNTLCRLDSVQQYTYLSSFHDSVSNATAFIDGVIP